MTGELWIECPVCGDDGPESRVERAIANIERVARAAVLRELREEVAGMAADTTNVSGGTFYWGIRAGNNAVMNAVLAAIDRRLGDD